MKNLEFKRDILENGIFVCETDTLYGICTSAFIKENVEEIYDIKGRDENKPFIILLSQVADLKSFNITLTPKQKKYLDEIWPGKVSVILPCPHKKFEYLHRGTESLAFRIPKKRSIQDILEITGPLVAPSANKQGQKPAETVTEAKQVFGDDIDAYFSGGKLSGAPSTLITFKDDKLVCLREGAVPFDSLQILYTTI
jgi:L-threonylcarbamoyladenylate synthase